VRGSGSLVGVVTAEETERNYVPSRPQPSYRTVLMIGKAEAGAGEYKPVKRNNAEGAVALEKETKPIQSLFTILKNEFDKNENDEMETVEKGKKFDGQGAQSFTIEFGQGSEHQDSPKSCLKARETAFESPSSSALGLPVAQTGGRWLSDEKRQAQREESMKFKDVGAKKNKNKQTKTKAQHSSPPCSLPSKAFRKPRKFDRGKLAKASRDSVAFLSNSAVTFSTNTRNPTMDPKEPSEPKDAMASVWEKDSLEGEHFQHDDHVMMITVPKKGGRCGVLYLNAASDSEDMRLANRATFPVGTSVEEILDRRPPKRENQSVFREYQPGPRRERKLKPFTFDDEALASSSNEDKRRPQASPDLLKIQMSPRKRDRPLRKSAKETDAEQGSFLTAMGSEEGEKSSSSSIKYLLMGSEEGEKSSSSSIKSPSIKKKKYKEKLECDDWGRVQDPSFRPTWGRFMYDEDEKRVAEEWRDTGRRNEKRKQEEHVARGNSPIKKGKEESSAFDDLNKTYIDPFDCPPPEPKSSTLFITGGYGGGYQYKTKEVKVIKRNNKEKSIGCLTQEETANPDKETMLVEMTWTPSDQESGKEDITKTIEFIRVVLQYRSVSDARV
jgi:hypothetical protein